MSRKYTYEELAEFVCRIDTAEKAQIARNFLSKLIGIPRWQYKTLIRTIETIEFVNGWGDFVQ